MNKILERDIFGCIKLDQVINYGDDLGFYSVPEFVEEEWTRDEK